MTKPEVKLEVLIEDATPEEKVRGAVAAEAVFMRAGINPWAAFDALFKADSAEELAEADRQLIALMEDAQRAAAEACCAGWTDRPDRIGIAAADLPQEPDSLGLVRREEAGLEIVVGRGDELVKLFVQYATLDVLGGCWGEFVAKAQSHRAEVLKIAKMKLHLGMLGRDGRVHVNVAVLTDPQLGRVSADAPRLTSPPWEDKFSRMLAPVRSTSEILH
jgi:hypothetical protein